MYVAPVFDRLEREAMRAWRAARYRGERNRPPHGDFDPLWLRLGMRMNCIASRAGWVVSNPLLDQSLRMNPKHDESLGGSSWLIAVYRRERHLVALPSARTAMDARLSVLRQAKRAAAPAPAVDPPPLATAKEQQDLFV